MTLHASIWVWGGTVMIALFALAFLFLIHGQAKAALSLFFGANVLAVLVWLLGSSLRRAYPPGRAGRGERHTPPGPAERGGVIPTQG